MEGFKPYLPDISGKAIPCLYFKPKPKVPESDDYVIDKILQQRIYKGKHQWKIRWKGYGPEDDTWEPAQSFVGFVHQDCIKCNK
jgi:hypothetical protein